MDFSGNFKKFLSCQIFEKISILVKIYERHRFFREFGKISNLSNFRKNFDFGQNWRKFRKMSILVKFSKNFDFGHNFRKNFEFGQIFQKISILVNIFENCEKCRF